MDTGKVVTKQMHANGEVNMTGHVFMNNLKVVGKADLSSLHTETIHGGDLYIVGSASIRAANFDEDVISTTLQVRRNATISYLKVAKEIIVDGKISSYGDVVVEGFVSAQKLKVDGMIVSDGDIETRKSLNAKSLFLKETGKVNVLEANSIIASTTIGCTNVQADIIHSTALHVGGSIDCSGGILTKSLT